MKNSLRDHQVKFLKKLFSNLPSSVSKKLIENIRIETAKMNEQDFKAYSYGVFKYFRRMKYD
jgi:hypothetical protein